MMSWFGYEIPYKAFRRYIDSTPASVALVGIFGLCYALQRLVLWQYGSDWLLTLFYVRYDYLGFFWTWVTAPLAHAGVLHLLINSWFTLTYGRWVERSVGTRRYLGAFLVGGGFTAVVGTLIVGTLGIPPMSFIGNLYPQPITEYQGGVGASMGMTVVFGMILAYAPTGRIEIFGFYPRRWAVLVVALTISLAGTLVDGAPLRLVHPYHLVGFALGGFCGYVLMRTGSPRLSNQSRK